MSTNQLTYLLYSRNEPHLVPPRLPHLRAARRKRFRKRNAPPIEHVTCSVLFCVFVSGWGGYVCQEREDS